jgi:radical SAM superfamily enzyme YgiQ (UPF0313 family)
MDLQGTVIRPPSEAGSVLLQVSLGCTHGKCAFCGAYLDKPRFAVKDHAQVLTDLQWAARHRPDARRVFLCDGDAMSLPQPRLEEILAAVKDRLPMVTRVSAYGNARGLRHKSAEQLRRLRELGLGMIYMGLESGDEATLARMNKGSTAASIIEQGRRVMDSGMKLNVTVINGLGGVELSMVHARETGRALSELNPHQAAALSLMLVPGTSLHRDSEQGLFMVPDAMGMLAELREMVACLDMKGLFLANHASNYVPIRARMPRDRDAVLGALDSVLAGRGAMRDESLRRL